MLLSNGATPVGESPTGETFGQTRPQLDVSAGRRDTAEERNFPPVKPRVATNPSCPGAVARMDRVASPQVGTSEPLAAVASLAGA